MTATSRITNSLKNTLGLEIPRWQLHILSLAVGLRNFLLETLHVDGVP